jgi:hypothetical protein
MIWDDFRVYKALFECILVSELEKRDLQKQICSGELQNLSVSFHLTTNGLKKTKIQFN